MTVAWQYRVGTFNGLWSCARCLYLQRAQEGMDNSLPNVSQQQYSRRTC
jgi:hypothetical protein